MLGYSAIGEDSIGVGDAPAILSVVIPVKRASITLAARRATVSVSLFTVPDTPINIAVKRVSVALAARRATVTLGSSVTPGVPDYSGGASSYVGLRRMRRYTGAGLMLPAVVAPVFTPKRAAEVEFFTVDFVNLLTPGEAIVGTPTWTMTPLTGVDDNAAAMVVGSPTVAGSRVSALIGGGVAGVSYRMECVAQTSYGQTLVLPDPGFDVVKVVA